MAPTCDICCSTTSPTAGAALGRSWLLFVRSWPLWSSSWSLFGRSWDTLGCSWGALASLLGTLCPLLAALGPLLERRAKSNQKSMPKIIDLDVQKPSKRTPKSRGGIKGKGLPFRLRLRHRFRLIVFDVDCDRFPARSISKSIE